MNDRKNIKALLVGAGCILIAAYRLGGPFLEETKEMRKKSQEVQASIDAIRHEAAMFGKGWEDTMRTREQSLVNLLPHYLKPSDVLAYYLAKFEQMHPGRVWFLGVNYQRASSSTFGSAGGRGPLARSIRYRIKAELAQELLVPYIEHMEKFESIFRMESYSFDIAKERFNALELDITLEFFLAPMEWMPPGVPIAADQDPSQAPEGEKEPTWTALFSGSSRGVSMVPRNSGGGIGKLPKVDKIFGTSIILNESIYEEGDFINGWKILRVDSRRRRVIFKWGSVTKEVRVK